jgi:hypothetical protein
VAQDVADRIELVAVTPRASELRQHILTIIAFAGVRIVEVDEIRSIGAAYAAGVREASAPIVAMTEDHSFPRPDWASVLIGRHRESWAAVGPLMCNANPANLISWADMLLGYGPWMDPKSGGEREHLPGHNSSYKRDVLLEYGDRLPRLLEAETVLHWDLRAHGHRLFQDTAACTDHTNFALLRSWTFVQIYGGRAFAASRASTWSLPKRIAFALGSPLIPLGRLKRTVDTLRRSSSLRVMLWPRIAPLLFYGLVLDGMGQGLGYAFGAGRWREKLARYEFDRFKHILSDDRDRILGIALPDVRTAMPPEVR